MYLVHGRGSRVQIQATPGWRTKYIAVLFAICTCPINKTWLNGINGIQTQPNIDEKGLEYNLYCKQKIIYKKDK